MRKSRILAAGALGITATMALAACGGGSSSGNDGPSTNGKGKTLVVWNMTGDLTDATMKAINTEFTEQTGAKVKVETQQWDNIATKVTTALATSNPPDVIELGNTDVGSFAATGGLLDLTSQKSTLEQGGTWLPGLAGPATVDGKLYAVPAFAATRVVIYNKAMWAKAGVKSPPTTYKELTSDLDKIRKANSSVKDFSPFYLPGKYWYDGLQWVWDAGGEVATQADDGTWKGGLSSAASQKGLQAFKTFQNAYSSKASRTVDTAGTGQPDQDKDIFAQGKTSAILGNSWEIGAITQDNPKITAKDLGTFPFPGLSGKSQPVMLAGSDWGIAAKSDNADLAQTWVKIASSEAIQNGPIVGQGWIPVTQEEVKKAQAKVPAQNRAFYVAAQNSASTPAAAKWATIEADGAVQQFFSDIASGKKSVSDAAKGFDSHLDSVLNGQ